VSEFHTCGAYSKWGRTNAVYRVLKVFTFVQVLNVLLKRPSELYALVQALSTFAFHLRLFCK